MCQLESGGVWIPGIMAGMVPSGSSPMFAELYQFVVLTNHILHRRAHLPHRQPYGHQQTLVKTRPITAARLNSVRPYRNLFRYLQLALS
jgi:hypothetical protein